MVNILRSEADGQCEDSGCSNSAVARVDGEADTISGTTPVYEVTIVGYLGLVASGGSWYNGGEAPSAALQGAMCGAEQRCS